MTYFICFKGKSVTMSFNKSREANTDCKSSFEKLLRLLQSYPAGCVSSVLKRLLLLFAVIFFQSFRQKTTKKRQTLSPVVCFLLFWYSQTGTGSDAFCFLFQRNISAYVNGFFQKRKCFPSTCSQFILARKCEHVLTGRANRGSQQPCGGNK